MGRLTEKKAVITGGTTGLGYETAKRFLAEGARVIITGQDEKRLADAAKSLGQGAIAVRADVSNVAELDHLKGVVEKEFGTFDILFANAGVAKFAPLEVVEESGFDTLFDINVKGLFFTVQRLSSLLAQGGSVILNASGVHGKGIAGASVYTATKAAVRSFARSLAVELAPRGIRVNSLSPGYIPTEIQAKMGLSAEAVDQFKDGLLPNVPLGRVGRPDEIASTALFLASDESSYITGGDLAADGGFSNV